MENEECIRRAARSATPGDWLKRRFSDSEPILDISWTVAAEPRPTVLARMAEILFEPHLDGGAAFWQRIPSGSGRHPGGLPAAKGLM
ncbi:hypothetical protein ACFXGT_28770 [Streptomyces sp. NPDC059352]|uniref:hypothetical protein n=1 Tax=Streptomyces sp. NPDC059352 TaxID=3346810 RepID=UPI003683B073